MSSSQCRTSPLSSRTSIAHVQTWEDELAIDGVPMGCSTGTGLCLYVYRCNMWEEDVTDNQKPRLASFHMALLFQHATIRLLGLGPCCPDLPDAREQSYFGLPANTDSHFSRQTLRRYNISPGRDGGYHFHLYSFHASIFVPFILGISRIYCT